MVDSYPAKVTFRGFSKKDEEGFARIAALLEKDL
jgi:hypothetical protein